jgi:hypothetical protein
MKAIPSLLLGLLLCLFASLAGAAHITDKLVVGLYPEPVAEGTPIQLLSSGTPLEVLSRRSGFAEVRLADATRGWVEAVYVTEEKPAKAVLLETQARLRQMGMELAALRERQADAGNAAAGQSAAGGSVMPPTAPELELRAALEEAEARIAGLEKRLAGQDADVGAAGRVAELEAAVQEALSVLAESQGLALEAPGAAEEGLVGRHLVWLVALLALALGFVAGVAFIDYRIRKRYGGFRI